MPTAHAKNIRKRELVFAKIIDENEDERKRKPNPDWQSVAVIIKIDIY